MKYLVSPFKAKLEDGSVWIKKGADERWTRIWGSYGSDTVSLITQRFGANAIPYYNQIGMKGHNGTDWGTPNNTCIYAVHDGEITEATPVGDGYGARVRLQYMSEEGMESYIYGHLGTVLVSKGQKVRAGDLIALSDNSGVSTGPHLHTGRRFLDKSGAVLDYNNGYFGYTDEYDNYYETTLQESTDLKKLKEYFEGNGIWPWRKQNWLAAQKVLGISGHTRSQYYRYILKH